MNKVCKSIEELRQCAKFFIVDIASIKKDHAFVLFLEGELGAGKTTFVKMLAEELGVTGQIQSPTFVLEKIYTTKHPVFKKLVHIDAYRIEEESEVRILGLDKLRYEPETLICIEWPSKLKGIEILPDATLSLLHIDEQTREAKFIYE